MVVAEVIVVTAVHTVVVADVTAVITVRWPWPMLHVQIVPMPMRR